MFSFTHISIAPFRKICQHNVGLFKLRRGYYIEQYSFCGTDRWVALYTKFNNKTVLGKCCRQFHLMKHQFKTASIATPTERGSLNIALDDLYVIMMRSLYGVVLPLKSFAVVNKKDHARTLILQGFYGPSAFYKDGRKFLQVLINYLV